MRAKPPHRGQKCRRRAREEAPRDGVGEHTASTEPVCGAHASSTRWPGPQTLYCRTGGSALVSTCRWRHRRWVAAAGDGTGGAQHQTLAEARTAGVARRGHGCKPTLRRPAPKTQPPSRRDATHQGRKRGRCRARTRVFPLTHPLATLGGGPTSSRRSLLRWGPPTGGPQRSEAARPRHRTQTCRSVHPRLRQVGRLDFVVGTTHRAAPPPTAPWPRPLCLPLGRGHTNRPEGMHRVMPAVKAWPANGVRRLQRADDQKDWFSSGGGCASDSKNQLETGPTESGRAFLGRRGVPPPTTGDSVENRVGSERDGGWAENLILTRRSMTPVFPAKPRCGGPVAAT